MDLYPAMNQDFGSNRCFLLLFSATARVEKANFVFPSFPLSQWLVMSTLCEEVGNVVAWGRSNRFRHTQSSVAVAEVTVGPPQVV